MRTSRTIYQQLLAVLLIDSTIAPLPVARGSPAGRADQYHVRPTEYLRWFRCSGRPILIIRILHCRARGNEFLRLECPTAQEVSPYTF